MLFKRKPYKVKLLGRAGLLYQERGRSLLVDSEMLAGPNFDIVIYSDSIRRWDPPFEAKELSEAEVKRVKGNINEALKRLRIDWA